MSKESEYYRLRFDVQELRRELVKMLPKSSDTMSAVRQREITEFVVKRIDAALESAEQSELESGLREMEGFTCYDEYGVPTDHQAIIKGLLYRRES